MKSLVALWLLAGVPDRADPSATATAASALGEWFITAGYGTAVNLGPGNTDVEIALIAPQWSRALTPSLEYLVEGHFSRYFTPNGHFGGLMPVGVRLSTGNGGGRIFISAGAGLGWTDLTGLPEIDRRFNFLLQGGLGMRWRHSQREDHFLEVRLLHLSNAGTTGRNFGLNSVTLVGGWRVR